MGRFFWLLIILILSVWLGLKVAEDPGYAVFIYRQWSVEMPLWFAIVSFLVLMLVVYGLLRFFDGIDFTLYRLKNWLRWRRKYKSYSKTNRGLVELIEGQWRSAEYYLLEGVAQSDAPLINYLASAKAAQEQKAYDRRDNYLRKAHDVAPQAQVAIGLTQAQLQIEQNQLEQALAGLTHLQKQAPKHPFILKLLEKVYIKLADWNSLLKLLPSLYKAKLITKEQLLQFEVNMYEDILKAAAQKNVDVSSVDQIWQSIPKNLQKNPKLVYAYVKQLMKDPERSDQAEKLINQVLKKTWSKELVELYGEVKTSNPSKQLATAEGWQKSYGQQAILLLTLGQLAMRCQLWGKARAYFEESLRLEALPETYQAYGRLLDQLGETQAALEQYRVGLSLVC